MTLPRHRIQTPLQPATTVALSLTRARLRAFAITMAAAALLALAGCSLEAQEVTAPPPPEVSVAPVVHRDIAEWNSFTGRIAAVETVELRPRVGGYI